MKKKFSIIKWHKYRYNNGDYDLFGNVGQYKYIFWIWENEESKPKRQCLDKWIMTWEENIMDHEYFFPTQRDAKKYAETLALLWLFKVKIK